MEHGFTQPMFGSLHHKAYIFCPITITAQKFLKVCWTSKQAGYEKMILWLWREISEGFAYADWTPEAAVFKYDLGGEDLEALVELHSLFEYLMKPRLSL